jgi:hypothetical protein
MHTRDSKSAVLAIVSRFTGKPPSSLDLEDRLLQDLGVDGDDAVEILIALSRDLNADMSALVVEKYFRPEPDITTVFRSRAKVRAELAEKIPVRIRDLVLAVDTGRWPL